MVKKVLQVFSRKCSSNVPQMYSPIEENDDLLGQRLQSGIYNKHLSWSFINIQSRGDWKNWVSVERLTAQGQVGLIAHQLKLPKVKGVSVVQ